MDRGLTIENPYASVTIPRAQLKDGFLRYSLGDDLTSDTILFNPSILPTYPTAQAKEVMVAQNGQKIQEQKEAWARPANPYASLKVPRASSPEPFRWKSPDAAAPESHNSSDGSSCCCCCCSSSSGCQKGCSCCRKCCCVIS